VALPAHMAILLVCHTAGNYAMLRLYNHSSLIIYSVWPLIVLVATTFETLAYTFAARLYEESKIQIFSAKRIYSKNMHIQRRQFRAMRPVRVDIGSFFPLKKSTLLVFSFCIIDNTITLLLV